MDFSHLGADGPRDRFVSKRQEVLWLYDPVAEEFQRDPGIIPGRAPNIPPGRSGALSREPPRSAFGRLVYGLVVQGWLCPLFFGGLMGTAILAWLLGFH